MSQELPEALCGLLWELLSSGRQMEEAPSVSLSNPNEQQFVLQFVYLWVFAWAFPII